MTPAEVLEKCNAIEKRLADMGYVCPQCHAAVNWLHAGETVVWIEYRSADRAPEKSKYFGNPADQGFNFKGLEAFLAELPTVSEARKTDFMHALGRLIDQGREADIPVDFLNPLEASMKALSENVLESA